MNNESYKIAYENVMVANKMLEKEMERLKEQLNDEIEEELKQSEIMVKKQEEIERLNNRIDKAIYMIEDLMANNLEIHKGEPILKILQGEDKE